MKVVYVSGPYRSDSVWGIAQNVEEARRVARELWRRGLVAICPHSNTAMMDGDGIDFLAGDLELVRRSDAVLMLEGWQTSEGAKWERSEAIRRGIPVFYSLESLVAAVEQEGQSVVEVRQDGMRRFSTGATRDGDVEKLDIEGFVSPVVLLRYAEYMHKNRKTPSGLRDSDNWQKGIPLDAYMKSAMRHVMEWWLLHRGFPDSVYGGSRKCDVERLRDALCGVLFNAMGYLYELEIGQLAADGSRKQLACGATASRVSGL